MTNTKVWMKSLKIETFGFGNYACIILMYLLYSQTYLSVLWNYLQLCFLEKCVFLKRRLNCPLFLLCRTLVVTCLRHRNKGTCELEPLAYRRSHATFGGKIFCKFLSRAPKKRIVTVEQKRIIASVNLACLTHLTLSVVSFTMFQNAKSLKTDWAMILEQKAFSGFCYIQNTYRCTGVKIFK